MRQKNKLIEYFCGFLLHMAAARARTCLPAKFFQTSGLARYYISSSVKWYIDGKAGFIMPQLSILIPAYNSTRSLPPLVVNLLAQAAGRYDIELVICPDDGADYPSLLPDDSRITFAPCGLKSGPGIARTRALNSAKGDFVTWVDADDWLDDSYLANVFMGLERHTAFAVRPEYRRQDGVVRRLNANVLDAKRLCDFYGSVPVVAPRHWLTCFPDVVAEDVIVSMRVLRANGGSLPVVNAGYHFILNDESYCARYGATFSVAYRDNLSSLESLAISMGTAELVDDLKILFETRLAMSEKFDSEIALDPDADYHQFVLCQSNKPIESSCASSFGR